MYLGKLWIWGTQIIVRAGRYDVDKLGFELDDVRSVLDMEKVVYRIHKVVEMESTS